MSGGKTVLHSPTSASDELLDPDPPEKCDLF